MRWHPCGPLFTIGENFILSPRSDPTLSARTESLSDRRHHGYPVRNVMGCPPAEWLKRDASAEESLVTAHVQPAPDFFGFTGVTEQGSSNSDAVFMTTRRVILTLFGRCVYDNTHSYLIDI